MRAALLCLALTALPALGHATESPGEMLTRAQALLDHGDVDGATALARAIIQGAPTAARARLLLAQAHELNGKTDAARATLRWVVENGAPPLAAIARHRLTGVAPDLEWGVRARTGAAYDSAVLPPGARDPSSTADARVELGAAVTARRRRWRAALGLDRTLHQSADAADATILGLTNRLHLGRSVDRLALTVDTQALFAERTPRLHHTRVGGDVTWWRAQTWSPFVQAGAHWAAYQGVAERPDAPHEARLAGATGLRWLGGRETISLRVDGRWIGPDAATGFTDVGATLGGAVQWGRWRVHGYGGYGLRWTDLGREGRLRGGTGLGWTPTPGWTVRADLRWLAARRDPDPVDRLITGLTLEVRR